MGGQLPEFGCTEDSRRGPHISCIRFPEGFRIPAPVQPLPQEAVGGWDNIQDQQGTVLPQPFNRVEYFDTASGCQEKAVNI